MQQPTSRRVRRTVLTALWSLAAFLVVTPAASAYIDPATTGTLFSAIVAGLAAAGTALTMFWSRIIGFFRRDPSSGSTSE
jgi:hypothetical protein